MDKHKGIKRTNFSYIEFVLRNESNKLRMLQEANVENIRKIWSSLQVVANQPLVETIKLFMA